MRAGDGGITDTVARRGACDVDPASGVTGGQTAKIARRGYRGSKPESVTALAKISAHCDDQHRGCAQASSGAVRLDIRHNAGCYHRRAGVQYYA